MQINCENNQKMQEGAQIEIFQQNQMLELSQITVQTILNTITSIFSLVFLNRLPTRKISSLFDEWISISVRDALIKNYLDGIILQFSDMNNDIIENYYVDVGAIINHQKEYSETQSEEIHNSILSLEKILTSFEPFTKKKMRISLRLIYNTSAPKKYEPPGFKCANQDYEKGKMKEFGIIGIDSKYLNQNEIENANSTLQKNQNQCETENQENTPKYTLNLLDKANNENTNSNTFQNISTNSLDCKTNDSIVKEQFTKSNSCNHSKTRKYWKNETFKMMKTENIDDSTKNSSLEKKIDEHVSSKNKNIKIKSDGIKHRKTIDKKQIGNEIASEKDGSNTQREIIFCPCAYNCDDGEMLRCDKCLIWSHTVCHGFYSNNDKRIPSQFICYFCFTGFYKKIENQTDHKIIFELKRNNLYRLALYRRSLHFLYNNGISSIKDLSQKVNVGYSKAHSIIGKLLADGFAVRLKKGIKVQYQSVNSDKNKKLIKKYFTVGRTDSVPLKDLSIHEI